MPILLALVAILLSLNITNATSGGSDACPNSSQEIRLPRPPYRCRPITSEQTPHDARSAALPSSLSHSHKRNARIGRRAPAILYGPIEYCDYQSIGAWPDHEQAAEHESRHATDHE
jgi:hypothetical protein